MCAVMLPDGRWTYVPTRSGLSSPRSGRVETASPREHPDDRRAVAVLVAHDARAEPLLVEQ
jgi:hypothetical protein